MNSFDLRNISLIKIQGRSPNVYVTILTKISVGVHLSLLMRQHGVPNDLLLRL